MKSQLKGGWTGKWNEIFNGLSTVIINEMESSGHGCDLQVGLGQGPVGVGPRRRRIFQKIIRLYILPASAFPSLRTFSWSWAPRCGQEAVVTSWGAESIPVGGKSCPWVQAWEEGRAAARQRLPDSRSHWLSCSDRKLLFMAMLTHRSIHFRVCFTQRFSLNAGCKQRMRPRHAGFHAWYHPTAPPPRTLRGFLRLPGLFLSDKHGSLWTPWGFFSTGTFL